MYLHYCTFFSNSIAIMQYFNSVEFYWLFAIIANIAIIAFLMQKKFNNTNPWKQHYLWHAKISKKLAFQVFKPPWKISYKWVNKTTKSKIATFWNLFCLLCTLLIWRRDACIHNLLNWTSQQVIIMTLFSRFPICREFWGQMLKMVCKFSLVPDHMFYRYYLSWIVYYTYF